MKYGAALRRAEVKKTVLSWRWHRLLGVTAAVPFLIIALTGCLLASKDGLQPLLPTSLGDPWPVVYKLHRSLLAGEPGKWLVSGLGLSLWTMWLTGRRMAQRASRRHPRSWHQRLGRWTGGILAVICTLGALANFRGPLGDWLDPVGPLDPQHPVTVAPEVLTTAQQAAQLLHPEDQPAQLRLPKLNQPYLLFFHADGTRIYADPISGQIVKVRTNGSHWTNALLPLHSLEVLGAVGAWLAAGLSLTFLLLAWLGLLKMRRKLNRCR